MYQVSTFQNTAPNRAASRTYGVTMAVFTNPLPTVAATPVPRKKAAKKLNRPAMLTACRGLSTRVATTVATELAASWNPFTKSNSRARPMMTITRSRSDMSSAVFHGYVLDYVSNVFQEIGGV